MAPHSESESPDSTGITALKLSSLAVVIVMSIFGYGIALKTKGSISVLCLGNAFAAGILLAGGLVHLIPEGTEEFSEWSEESLDGFPLISVIVGVTYLVLVMVEKTIHGLAHKNHTEDKPRSNESSLSVNETISTTEERAAHPDIPQFDSLIILAGICFHALISGLSVGAGEDSSQILGSIIPIAAHKIFEAFGVGIAITASNVSLKRFVILGAIFTSATPIGIGIGWALVHSGGLSHLGVAVCLALSGGTFLWAALEEFLPVAFKYKGKTLGKFGCLTVGFAAMSVLKIWV